MERPSADPRALSSQLAGHGAGQTRGPPGHGGGPVKQGECRARPSAPAAGMVSWLKAEGAGGRPQEGSTAIILGAYARLRPTVD